MHRRRVEWIVASAHAQEAGGLLERLRPESRHVAELNTRLESATAVASLHDVRRERRTNPRDIRQQRHRRRVHLDAHAVHAALYHFVEALFESRLRDVVLILTDTDRLRIDLYQ